MNKSLILPLLLSTLLFIGCEDAKDDANSSWNNLKDSTANKQNTAAANTNQQTAQQTNGQTADIQWSNNTNFKLVNGNIQNFTTGGAGDAVSFGALNFCYGGFNGSGASQSGVQISGLNVSGDSLSFKYVKNLSAWGFSSGQADALACLFVQKADGSWVGGKFDWISSSRTSRNLENVVKYHYCGWSLSGVPNPCNAAFVIVHKDGKRRSNVISGSWKR